MSRSPKIYLLVFMVSVLLGCSLSSVAMAGERRVIVGFHQSPGVFERALIRRHKGKLKHSFSAIKALSVKLTDSAISELQNDPRVAYVEEDAVVMAIDGEFGNSAEYLESWGVARVEAPAVHAENVTGAGVKVAILDTGIDYTHPDLDANYGGGINLVDSTTPADPFDDSLSGHGTHVAGVIGAELDGNGIVGVAPNVSLYAVKVLDSNGYGFLSDILAGLEWAIANDMDVVNMSLGLTTSSEALEEVCARAYENGILLIAAAGNTGLYGGGKVLYPALYPSVISVGATDAADAIYRSSARGADLEVVAPGAGIYSTVPHGIDEYHCPPPVVDGYCYLTGTSQAAPYVAGVAALILSAGLYDINGDGVVDAKDLRLQLQNATFDLGDPGEDDVYGFGLVNAQAATTENLAWLNSYQPDRDNDGIADNVDNCKYRYNPDQADYDGDGIGNVCDTQNGSASALSDRVSLARYWQIMSRTLRRQ